MFCYALAFCAVLFAGSVQAADLPDRPIRTRVGGTEDFWLIFTLLGVTMSQKSSVIQIASLVP